MSAQPFAQRRGWLAALVAQVEGFVFEEAEAEPAPAPVALKPHPVVSVVSAAPRSGASTVARLLAAELGWRAAGAAVVASSQIPRRGGPPARAALRLATALGSAAPATASGRVCLARMQAGSESPGDDPTKLADAARYLAPVVFDVPPDGSAIRIVGVVDAIVVVAGSASEPALLDAVATIVAGDPAGGRAPIKVANRIGDHDRWAGRAELLLPESRLGARAAMLGTRAHGQLGSAISELTDAAERRDGS